MSLPADTTHAAILQGRTVIKDRGHRPGFQTLSPLDHRRATTFDHPRGFLQGRGHHARKQPRRHRRPARLCPPASSGGSGGEAGGRVEGNDGGLGFRLCRPSERDVCQLGPRLWKEPRRSTKMGGETVDRLRNFDLPSRKLMCQFYQRSFST
jgi:hypothetical protein